MIGELSGMRLLELINYVVILPVVIELLFELLDALLETFLGIEHLQTHFCHLVLVVFFNLLFSIFDLELVLFELLLSLLPLLCVPLLSLLYHLLYLSPFSGLVKGFFLLGDNVVGLS